MLFSYGSGQQWIDDSQKCRRIAGDFDWHADAAVRREAHCPMEHVQGFIQSHWMPPSCECMRHIAPVAATVDEFVETTQKTNKTQLLASNYGTFWLLLFKRISYPEMDPLLSSSMQRASFKCATAQLERKSSRTFLTIKCCQGKKSKKLFSNYEAR